MHPFTKQFLSYKEESYKQFQIKLIPDTNKEILGVRTPFVKKIVKEHKANKQLILDFISQKHTFYEEFLLHGLLLATEKDINALLENLCAFSTQVDNWAVCDATISAIKLLKYYPSQTLEIVKEFIKIYSEV